MRTTLQDALRQRVPESAELRRVLARSAQALAEWQRAHGPHGSLAPDAITVEADGTVRIEAPAGSADGFIADATAYRSPRQLAPGAAAQPAHPEDDVYALAVIAWECLTGVAPHDVAFLLPTEALVVLHSAGAAQGVLPPDTSDRAARALRAAMDLRPGRRPTAQALADALAERRRPRRAAETLALALLAGLAISAALAALWLLARTW
jgi:serine/threonine-protein kinase